MSPAARLPARAFTTRDHCPGVKNTEIRHGLEAKNKRYKKTPKSRSIIPLLEYYYCCYNRRSVGRQSFDSVFVGQLLYYIIFLYLLQLLVAPFLHATCEWKTIKTHDNYDCCYCYVSHIIHNNNNIS